MTEAKVESNSGNLSGAINGDKTTEAVPSPSPSLVATTSSVVSSTSSTRTAPVHYTDSRDLVSTRSDNDTTEFEVVYGHPKTPPTTPRRRDPFAIYTDTSSDSLSRTPSSISSTCVIHGSGNPQLTAYELSVETYRSDPSNERGPAYISALQKFVVENTPNLMSYKEGTGAREAGGRSIGTCTLASFRTHTDAMLVREHIEHLTYGQVLYEYAGRYKVYTHWQSAQMASDFMRAGWQFEDFNDDIRGVSMRTERPPRGPLYVHGSSATMLVKGFCPMITDATLFNAFLPFHCTAATREPNNSLRLEMRCVADCDALSTALDGASFFGTLLFVQTA